MPEDVLDPGFAAVARVGRSHSLHDYLTAVRRRDELGIRMSRFHEDWDLLVTPATPIPPFAAGRVVPEGWPETGWKSWTPFTYPFKLTHQPAPSVPGAPALQV